jgi:hypothetical protein
VKQQRKLTAGQAAYVAHRIAGLRPQAAYRAAFPDASPRTLRCKPYNMEKNPRVRAAVEAAIQKDTFSMAKLVEAGGDAKAIMAAAGLAQEVAEVGLSRAEKRRILKRIATDRKASRIDRLRAIQVDNLMTGDNKPVRFEGEVTLHTIFQALAGTTGLPADKELIELNPAEPVIP